MRIGDGVPRWARRRVERHFARHSDGKIVRWMAFGTAQERMRAGAVPAEAVANVLPFLRRAAIGEPGATAPLDATGS